MVQRYNSICGVNNMRKLTDYIGGVRNSSPAIAGSPFGSANRRICGFAFGYAQICSAYALRTSHIPRTLSEIRLGGFAQGKGKFNMENFDNVAVRRWKYGYCN